MRSTSIRINGPVKRRRAQRFDAALRGRSGDERLRPRRRRARFVGIVTGALCGMITVGALAWGSHQPRFQIDSIAVEGNSAISKKALTAYVETILNDGRLHLFSRTNLFLFPQREIEQKVSLEFLRLAQATVSFRSLKERTLLLKVAERLPYARWCSGKQCYLMDEHGLLFAREDGSALLRDEVFEGGLGLPSSNMTGAHFLPAHFTSVLETMKLVEREGVNIVRASVENEHDFHLELQNGTVVFARFQDEPAVIAEGLKLALQSDALASKMANISYIDLRFKNRIYYKFR